MALSQVVGEVVKPFRPRKHAADSITRVEFYAAFRALYLDQHPGTPETEWYTELWRKVYQARAASLSIEQEVPNG